MVTKVIINYLVIDNTKIIDSFESIDSKYEKYYYQSILCDILGKRVWEDVPPNDFEKMWLVKKPCQEWCVNFYNFLKLSKIITSIFKIKVLVFYMSRYLVKRSPYISADRRLYWYWFILFFLLIYLKKC